MVTRISSSAVTPLLTVYSTVVSNISTVVSGVATNVASPSELIVIVPTTTPLSDNSTGKPTSPVSLLTSLTVKLLAGTSGSVSFVSTLKTTVSSSSTLAASATPTGSARATQQANSKNTTNTVCVINVLKNTCVFIVLPNSKALAISALNHYVCCRRTTRTKDGNSKYLRPT